MADRRDPQAHNNEADSAPETLIKILRQHHHTRLYFGKNLERVTGLQRSPRKRLIYMNGLAKT
ncbi:MAG: hypothetical protein V9G21_12415 [Methylotenera sp.]